MRDRPCRGTLLALCLAATPASAEELPTRFEAAVRVGLGIPDRQRGGRDHPRALRHEPVGPGRLDRSRSSSSWARASVRPSSAATSPTPSARRAARSRAAPARSANNVRFGFEVLWHLAPDRPVDPWVGLGVGYEWLNLSISGTGGHHHGSARGFEWVNLQLGIDFLLGRSFRLGPFVRGRVAQYDTGEPRAHQPAGQRRERDQRHPRARRCTPGSTWGCVLRSCCDKR